MKKIYLIDWNSFIYRMFFALPEFATKTWKIVNATFGMAKFFTGQLTKEKPDYLVFIKDAKWENFRHKIYSEYKATRDRMPDNLRSQISDIEEMISKMWIKIVEIENCEADDVIWKLAVDFWANDDFEIDILTWDKDLYSLVRENVKIYDTMKKKKFWLEETKEKFWIESNMIIDYLAIVWDKADNIPGIDWFGPKKAIELINKIWKVEDIYETVSQIESSLSLEDIHSELDADSIKAISSCFKWKTYEKLRNSRDDAFLSKTLASLNFDIDLWDFDLDDYKFYPDKIKNDEVIDFFRSLEFSSLLVASENKKLQTWTDLNLKVNLVWDKIWLDDLFESISKYDKVVLDTETSSLSIYDAEFIWLSIYLDDDHIYYINLAHHWAKVFREDIINFLEKLFSLDMLIVGHNLKYDLEILDIYMWKLDLKYNLWENAQEKIDKQMILDL